MRWIAVGALDAAERSRLRAHLDDDERARADRYRFAVDHDASVAAHALARGMLADIGGIAPPHWRFVAGAHGKPEIAPGSGPPGLRMNISHTRGFVACAVGWDDDLGIDVEALDRPRPPDLAIADRFFAPSEVARVRAAAAEDALETFFRFWTLKEAFIKATGEGLARALDSFSFTLDPVAITFAPPVDDPAAWRFEQFRPTARHLLALAVHRPITAAYRLDARTACLRAV